MRDWGRKEINGEKEIILQQRMSWSLYSSLVGDIRCQCCVSKVVRWVCHRCRQCAVCVWCRRGDIVMIMWHSYTPPCSEKERSRGGGFWLWVLGRFLPPACPPAHGPPPIPTSAPLLLCHGSAHDTCPQGRPRVARPSKARTKNIGRKEYRESRRKHVDQPDGSGQEYWRIEWTHQITCRLEISVLIMGLDMIGW